MLEDLEPLEEPLEILDLPDGGKIELEITDWKLGRTTIVKRDTGVEKEIPVLRVFVPPGTKETVPYYWDITSKTLQAGLLAYLKAEGYRNKVFVVTKHGVPPTARFTLEVKPRR